MRGFFLVVGMLALGCSGEAGDEPQGETGAAETAGTWCCEVKASDGNLRFARNCGLSEEDAISWMRDPLEICWDDSL